MTRWKAIALGFAVGLAATAAGCGNGRTELSGGEVAGDSLLAYRTLDYSLTSDRYQQWRLAQQALDSANVTPRVRLDTRRLNDNDVDRVISDLEADAVARAAIESSGSSVRDYVLTTIALAQSWDAVNRRGPRYSSVPRENIVFLQQQSGDDMIRSRPRARILSDNDDDTDDDDSDEDDSDEDDSDDDARPRRTPPRQRGRDSDSDS